MLLEIIDLESDDSTTAKRCVPASTGSRLDALPKDAASLSKSKETNNKSNPASRLEEDKCMDNQTLTQVAQLMFEAQEDKLKDIIRPSMSLLRDFSELDEPECVKKIAAIRKALMKYEMRIVQVWELQDRTRRSEIEECHSAAEKLHSDADAENEMMLRLTTMLSKEKLRKRQYEAHEATASQINQKRTRLELQIDIDAKTADIEQLRRQNQQLNELTNILHRKGQLL